MDHAMRPVNPITILVTALLLLLIGPTPARADDRPNFLLITCEDMGPDLGCFGVDSAITPRLDALAEQGVRYTAAYANAPVCSPARTALLFSQYQASLGASNHRSRPRLEPGIRGFAALLRDAGYYCTNRPKMDTNADQPWVIERATYNKGEGWWDEARGDRPFLAVRNLAVTHQSRTSVWPYAQYEKQILSKLGAREINQPEDVEVPPYYPDTPAVRRELARYANCVTLMDRQAGELLDRLERDGLADDTIVMFFSDHGAGHPLHKKSPFDRGSRVPLIVRIPEKWAHLRTAPAGGTDGRVVMFIDIGPTILDAAGVAVPEHMHGRPFLGTEPPHRFAFIARDRLGEDFDHARTVSDGRYAYVRNFFPHRPHWVRTGYGFPSTIYQEMTRCDDAGLLDGPAAAMFVQPRPAEAIFDLERDPHETHNIAGDPRHADRVAAMRDALRAHLRRTRDLGLVPEAILEARAGGEPRPRLRHDPSRLPLDRVHDAAMLVGMGPGVASAQLDAAGDVHEAVRYWALAGLRSQDIALPGVRQALLAGLSDPSPSVRTMAAGSCLHAGVEPDRARAALLGVLRADSYSAAAEAARTGQLAGFVDDEFLALVDAAAARWDDYIPPQIAASVRRVRAGLEHPASLGFGID